MRCLVKFITRRKSGLTSIKSCEIDKDTICIGRATDQDIFLPDIRVAYQHAEIFSGSGGTLYILPLALSGIKVNNQTVSSTPLTPDLLLQIGNYQLRVVQNDQFDIELEIEQTISDDSRDLQLQQEAKVDLSNAGLSKRLCSWASILTVLLLFLIFPIISSLYQPIKNLLVSVPLVPSDISWNSGELSSAHHFFKDDCRNCHQTPFIQVKDQACIDCHSKTAKHAKDELMQTKPARCQQCHKEHNGSEDIIISNNQFCIDCHQDLEQSLADRTELLNVANFSYAHPEFKPTILYETEDDRQQFYRIALDDKNNLKESNTLLFSHKAHLNPDKPGKFKQLTQGKNKLDCIDCHIPDSGNARMQPILYDQHCASCHKLEIGVKSKKRKLPHKSPAEAFYYIQQYYRALALEGGVEDMTAPRTVTRRRRPGQPLTRQERLEALAWAEKKTNLIALDVFKFTLCITCHKVSYISNEIPPWKIQKLYIPTQWMPLANFDHDQHVTMECGECHDVEKSEDGQDVLLPSIESCRECHGDSNDSNRLNSNCIDCHRFHISDELLHPEKIIIDRPGS